jgi:hypothetical protein
VHARTRRKRSTGWVVAMVVRGGGSAPNRKKGKCRSGRRGKGEVVGGDRSGGLRGRSKFGPRLGQCHGTAEERIKVLQRYRQFYDTKLFYTVFKIFVC